MVKDAKTVLAKVHKVIADGNTDKSLNEVLALANVTQDEYGEALEVSNKGSVVLLKREPTECMSKQLQWPSNASMARQYGFIECICLHNVCGLLHHENRQSHGCVAKVCGIRS